MGLDFDVDDVPALVTRIQQARHRAGRASEPFEIFLSPRGDAKADIYRRLEDMGVTAVIAPSWALQEGDFGSLDAKRRQLAEFAAAHF